MFILLRTDIAKRPSNPSQVKQLTANPVPQWSIRIHADLAAQQAKSSGVTSTRKRGNDLTVGTFVATPIRTARIVQASDNSSGNALVLIMGDEAISLSDRDLERRVKGFLGRQHFASLRTVEVSSQSGVITLSGRVNSFHERQLCINCCQRLAGVHGFNDHIEVAREHKISQPSLKIANTKRPSLAG